MKTLVLETNEKFDAYNIEHLCKVIFVSEISNTVIVRIELAFVSKLLEVDGIIGHHEETIGCFQY